jgi:hypothetical protein
MTIIGRAAEEATRDDQLTQRLLHSVVASIRAALEDFLRSTKVVATELARDEGKRDDENIYFHIGFARHYQRDPALTLQGHAPRH